MTQGTAAAPRRSPRPQTGTARRNSKAESRARAEDNRSLLSVAGAARYLDVSRWTVYRLINDGELKAVTVGAFLKVRPTDIDDYLDRKAS